MQPFGLRSRWVLCLVLCGGAILLTAAPDALVRWRFDRIAVRNGEYWRLLTGHFVHLNAFHLLLNLLGCAFVVEALWIGLPLWYGLWLIPVSCLGISAMLWWLDPGILWYAGLSGVLHALWSAGAMAGWCGIRRVDRPVSSCDAIPSRFPIGWGRGVSILAICLLVAKLSLEMLHVRPLAVSAWLQAPVVYAAHLYGAGIGAGYVVLARLLQRRQKTA